MLDLIVAAAMAATLSGDPVGSPDAAAVLVSPEDKLVCRSVRVTGSRMPTRQCKTQRDWRDRALRAQEKTEDWQAEQRRANRGGDNGSSAAGGRKPRARPG